MVLLCSFSVKSNEDTVYSDYQLVNQALWFFHNAGPSISPHEALLAYEQNAFQQNKNNTVSLGFTSHELWAALQVNTTANYTSRVLSIDNAWLDEIDVYFFEDNLLVNQVSMGDAIKFEQRPRNTRMPSVRHVFENGTTTVLFRFSSKDPMTIPIYIGSEESVFKKYTKDAYFYGALYGALLILLVYNLVLYFYLMERRYLFYSIYLTAFSLFNFTYTGHGYWLVWSFSPSLQQLLMPTLMFCYLVAAIMFTIEFLNTREFVPGLYRRRKFIYAALLALATAIILYGSRTFAVMSQLIVLTTIFIWMLLIGFYALKNGNPIAKYFIPAIALGTCGVTVSSLATWGVIPYSQWAFRGIEVGMLLEMSLLSISLGTSFKLVKDARKHAESNARLDPLTSLYNRRAFTDLINPMWTLGKRTGQPMAIVLIDLDWFKQINDEYGHTTGDNVLETIAKEIKSRIRQSDIPIRWGGEEFLLFLPNSDSEHALKLAEMLRECIEQVTFKESVRITASIGVASALPTDIELDALISIADEALYEAKQKGRNQVVVKHERLEQSRLF